MTGTIGMMTEGGARRVALEVVEAMVARMDGRPCPHVLPVGHSMRRLTPTSSGTSSSPPSWMLTVCPLVLPSPVEEEGLVPGAGAARVPRLADRSRQQICRTDLLGLSRVSQVLPSHMMGGAVGAGSGGRTVSREGMEGGIVGEAVGRMTGPRLYRLSGTLGGTEVRV